MTTAFGSAPLARRDATADLAPPPRRVPASLALRLLFGGGTFAWLWLAFASPLSALFLAKTDLSSATAFGGPLATVSGVVTGCEDTGASEGGHTGEHGTPVYANRYRFGEGDAAREGVSYATGTCLAAGAPVRVQHPAGRPEVSRIEGMRRAYFDAWAALVLAFPLIGVGLAGASLWNGARQVRLVRRGKLALGTLVRKESTDFFAQNRRIMKLRFALETDCGVRQEVVIRTHLADVLEDEPRERILYDPAAPARAVAWDVLRCAPGLDASGALQPEPLGAALRVLVPPAVALAGLALACSLLMG